MPKWQKRQRHELHVLYCNRKTDDSQCEEQREHQVHDGKFEPRQDDPNNVHDQRYRTARRFSCSNLSAKRSDDTPGEPKTHKAERNAYDRQAQQNATEDITQEDYESTEYEKNNIAEQRHNDYWSDDGLIIHFE